jgi:hypothetical protein
MRWEEQCKKEVETYTDAAGPTGNLGVDIRRKGTCLRRRGEPELDELAHEVTGRRALLRWECTHVIP